MLFRCGRECASGAGEVGELETSVPRGCIQFGGIPGELADRGDAIRNGLSSKVL